MKNLLLLFPLFIFCISINAQTNTWVGGDGYWDDPSMWSTGAIPNATETAEINNGTVKILSGFFAYAEKVQVLSGGRLVINSGGRLTVDGSSSSVHGVTVSGSLDVRGFLIVRHIDNGYGVQVSGSGNFTIHHYGIVNIFDVDGMGMWNSSDIINRGKLFIENTTSNGILNYGMLHNDGGKLSMLSIGGPAIYSYSSGYMINSGEIHVKGANSAIIVASNGYTINEEDGEIYVSYLSSSAISTSNNTNSLFENYGLVKANYSINNYGISNAGRVINHESGEIALDHAQFGIYNFVNSSLSNEGTISIGDQISNNAIRNDGDIENLPCGQIILHKRVVNTSGNHINNEGWIYNYSSSNMLNYGTFDNDGVIEDDPNTMSAAVSNNGIIALPLMGTVQAEESFDNALTLGSLASFTVGGWYTNKNLNTLAGEYDSGNNQWKPYASAVGLTEVFVVITHNNSGCSKVISIDIPNGVQPFSTPEVFGIQPGVTHTAEAQFMTYPNPSNGQFKLKTPQDVSGEYQLQLFHSTGQMVWEQTAELNQINDLNLQTIQGLSNGIYQLVVLKKGEILWQNQISIIQNY